jgi:hypothetical protein
MHEVCYKDKDEEGLQCMLCIGHWLFKKRSYKDFSINKEQ